MILTDKLVYIHLPKTGGTFVSSMLRQLHGRKGEGTKLSRLIARISGYHGGGYIDTNRNGTKHGTCSQIPFPFRTKPILSNCRNPYDSYVSGYEFGLWKRDKRIFNPNKEYSFEEYVKLRNELLEDEALKFDDLSLGYLSKRFIRFFFKQSGNQLGTINNSYLENKKYLEDMFPVNFIKKENLNQELYDYLLNVGYQTKEIEFILTYPKILPRESTRGEDKRWENYYTTELKTWVRMKERLLFAIFPEYDV